MLACTGTRKEACLQQKNIKMIQIHKRAQTRSSVSTCAASYVMVLVSVCTMGTSFVAISVFWAAKVSEIVTISVFTTGGWGGGRERGKWGEEEKVSAVKPDTVKGRQTHRVCALQHFPSMSTSLIKRFN